MRPGSRAYIWSAAACLILLARPARALDWQAGSGFKSAEIAPPAHGKPGFALLSPGLTGISFSNTLSIDRYTTNQIYLNGSGVAAGDVDGDGKCDLFFSGLGGRSALYRNLGDWKFADVTRSAGLALTNLDATGCVLADIDGDGDLDLILNTMGNGTHIFLNDGRGHFQGLPPVNQRQAGMSLAIGDVDGDGALDIYISNYRINTIRDEPNVNMRIEEIGGKLTVVRVNNRSTSEPDLIGRFTVGARGNLVENGEVDVLLRNAGQGRFTPVSFTDGSFLDENGKPLANPPYDWGLSVMFRDLNGDGAPDIYVCNDFASPDRIWINDGKGRFRALARTAVRHTSMFSMGIDFADLNRDGHEDFFVVDMLSREHLRRMVQTGNVPATESKSGDTEERLQYSHNTLFVNRGDDTFAEIAHFSGVEGSEWSWTPVFLDVDLDGYEDILITNGHERDAMNLDVINRGAAIAAEKKLSTFELQNLNNLFARLEVPKVAYRNRGDLRFEEVGKAWGFDTLSVSHGMALADLDGDGDLDVVMNNLNGVAGIYRNESVAPRVAVRLKGTAPNTRGIGAKIKVFGGAVAMQSQEMICGGRYLSGDDAMRVFAAGSLTNEMRIEVSWRSGKRSEVKGVKGNRIYEIDEAGAPALLESRSSGGKSAESQESPSRLTSAGTMFEDVSERIGHVHHEEEFNDFERQPLLPRKLSQLGPGVCWQDVDGDGWEDLVIGSGRGGRIALYHNDGGKKFSLMKEGPLNRVVGRDQTSVLGLGPVLIVGSSNYEDGQTNGGCVRIYDLKRQTGGESIMGQDWARGPLALGDVDGDGDLDLFVGGRCVPGRYPEPATSLLLRNEGGKFVIAQRFEKLGLVSGAVFSDLDGDGTPELVLACEWGPVKVFRKRGEKYEEETEKLGLSGYTGWWNGVTTGDVDGDGRMDIIASNWGKNSPYHASREHPLRLYYGDLSGSGGVDLVEAHYEGKEVPDRGWTAVRKALPFLQEKIESYEAYGRASVSELYGSRLQQGAVLEANTLGTTVFLNRGDHFEAKELPMEAQWTPAYGICVGDMDGDGKEDIFLSENFFAMNAEGSRNDAGRGLWLQGDGKGEFKAVQESGVKVYGEQRGCALSDFDGDGRVDLVVTQNGAATKLYHNVGARPGLRVKVNGGPNNPGGVGAQMRLRFGQRAGPMREIHAGSGYWSQDGAVQVMGTPEAATQIQVRWPGGKSTTTDLPTGAKEVELDTNGKLEVLH